MMNLQQSLNDDIRCEISNHFLDKVQYVCVFDKCTAEQRLCCSYCKFRYHNQHIQQLVKINDFTNKIQKEGELLNVKLQEKGQKGQLDSLYWQKIDKKINDEIQYASMQMQGVFSSIHQEVSTNIQQINNSIDERALGQSVFDLQTKVQRVLNRPWSHQSNEAIDLMAKIYRGDKYGELLEDEYFISHKNIQTINSYFANVHTKLEAFFKNIMEQIPHIFKESFQNINEKQGEVFNIRRKEKDATYPSIRTSSMRREQNGSEGLVSNNPSGYNQLIQNNGKPLISTQRSRSKKDLENQNNTLEFDRQQQQQEYQKMNSSQYGQRAASSLGSIMNVNNNQRPQSILFKQYDQKNNRNPQNGVDSLDAFAMQKQNQNNQQQRNNQGYYPFNQEDTFNNSEDPYIRYSKQLQQKRGNFQQNSMDRANYQNPNQNNRGGQQQVNQSDCSFQEEQILYSNLSFQQQQKEYSAVSINAQKQMLRNMMIQNRFSRSDFTKMRQNFAKLILENDHLFKKDKEDVKRIKKSKEKCFKNNDSQISSTKNLSNTLGEIKEMEDNLDQESTNNCGRQRAISLILFNPLKNNQSHIPPLQPLLENQNKSKNKNISKSTNILSKKQLQKVSPYLQPTCQNNSRRINKNDLNLNLNYINISPSQKSIFKTKKSKQNNNLINQQINQGYQDNTNGGNSYNSNYQEDNRMTNKSRLDYSDSQQNPRYLNNNSFDNQSPEGRLYSPMGKQQNNYNNNSYNGNGSLSHIPNDNELLSPTRSMADSPQKKMMSIILPSESNRMILPQGSKVHIPTEQELKKQQSHIKQAPQPKNFEDCKLKVQQAPMEFIQKQYESDQKKVKSNQPQKGWITQKNLPADLPQAKLLKEVQEKWGYLIIADTNNGQSRLGVYKSEKGNNYYDGEWFQGKRQGKGTYYLEDGSIYQGEWKNDEMTGKGRLIKKEGDIFEGDFVNEVFDGKGYLRYANGTEYIGNWKQNKFEGEGRKLWPNGAYYEGNFTNNQREGQGVFMWKNGSFFQGNFGNNQFNGYGIYQWQSGRLYEGDWKDGKMEGKGRDILEQGYVYEGQYQNDKKHGYGVFVFNENKIYKGFWDSDQPHGEGIMIENGVEKKGVWDHGQLVKKN